MITYGQMVNDAIIAINDLSLWVGERAPTFDDQKAIEDQFDDISDRLMTITDQLYEKEWLNGVR